MEAALPLRPASVRTVGDRVAIDSLVVDDPVAVRLVREREEASDDPVRLLLDAVEIGARVLDREQAGANAEFVRSEFEKQAREVEAAFGERAGAVAERLTRELERHFSDGSSEAVQHRVRTLVEETMKRSNNELVRGLIGDLNRQQGTHLRALLSELAAVKLEVQRLRAQEEKQAAVEAEHERGTAK